MSSSGQARSSASSRRRSAIVDSSWYAIAFSAARRFERRQDVEDVCHVFRLERDHDGLPTRQAANQPLKLQGAERLADRHPADAQLIGDVALIEGRAGGELAAQDRFA